MPEATPAIAGNRNPSDSVKIIMQRDNVKLVYYY